MYIYFLLLKIAALLGHKKARLLVEGQARAIAEVEQYTQDHAADGRKGWTWFHVASVGEFEQARPILERLKREQPQRKVLLTFFSPSGYELRKNYEGVDLVTYLPLATIRNARKWLDTVQPEMAVFVKYEFWPAYLKELNKREVPTYLISAIFRPTQTFFRSWGKPYRQLLHLFTHLYVQDENSRELLSQYGIENVTVAGDTRFDRVTAIAENAKQIDLVEHFTDGHKRVIIAGSTWPKDEELLARYVDSHPDVKLVLVPHEIHEEHLHRIFQIFHGRYVRFTETRHAMVTTCPTMVIDTIGYLSSIYQYGQVAYVGGGFGVGIHNTIEAAVWKMPVVFGPNYQRFREACGLIEAGAAASVSNYEELEAALDIALANNNEMGRRAGEYVRSELGATERICATLLRG